jgi:hypothetical protein
VQVVAGVGVLVDAYAIFGRETLDEMTNFALVFVVEH